MVAMMIENISLISVHAKKNLGADDNISVRLDTEGGHCEVCVRFSMLTQVPAKVYLKVVERCGEER